MVEYLYEERYNTRTGMEKLYKWKNGFEFDICVGAILATKDGRHIGNGLIIGKKHLNSVVDELWIVETDYGNEVYLTENEIKSLFYVGPKRCEVFND